MRAQRLIGDGPADVYETVRSIGGIQAQSTPAARLAVRPRSTGLTAESVRRACNDERSVVRLWAMRGTLHMIAAEDAGWLVALLGPRFAAANRRRRNQLGLDEDTCARGLRAIVQVLDAPLTRAELVGRLADRGVALDPKSQAPAHLIGYAAQQGLICRGPDLPDDEPTYVRWEDWIAPQPALEPDAALAELARRYVHGYAPAGPEDFAAWAGIPLGKARRGFELIAYSDETPAVVQAEPCLRLLAAFDTYLLGYRDRDLMLAPRFAKRVQAGGGWIRPTVVVDGRVVGTWRQQRTRDGLSVVIEPFEPLPRELLPALEAEVADVGRFLGVPSTLSAWPT
jgi:winged helix DNA-binding protein